MKKIDKTKEPSPCLFRGFSKLEVKVQSKEINYILRAHGIGCDYEEIDETPRFAVHHMHKWDHGYYEWWGTKVYEGGIHETGDWFWGTRRAFYADFREMTDFLKQYFCMANVLRCIVAPCWQYYQFNCGEFVEDNDICEETYLLLRKYGIRRGERSGILLDVEKDWNEIELILEGGFRGYTTLCLLLPERGVLLTPDHHFGVSFHTQNKELERALAKEVLVKYPTLRLWEEDKGTVLSS